MLTITCEYTLLAIKLAYMVEYNITVDHLFLGLLASYICCNGIVYVASGCINTLKLSGYITPTLKLFLHSNYVDSWITIGYCSTVANYFYRYTR